MDTAEQSHARFRPFTNPGAFWICEQMILWGAGMHQRSAISLKNLRTGGQTTGTALPRMRVAPKEVAMLIPGFSYDIKTFSICQTNQIALLRRFGPLTSMLSFSNRCRSP
jgi:hypothetical protein